MILLAGVLLGIVPFALSDTVNGAIIAGIFSVVNTILNLRLIRHARQTQVAVADTADQLTAVKVTAREATEAMKEQVHQHEQEAKQHGPS